jgi:thiamine biosynthesis protein ThiI
VNPDLLLVHYHEIGLKGGNRPRFEQALRRNLREALGDSAGSVRILSGRMEILDPKPDALERVQRVFGVQNVSPAFLVEANLPAMVTRALEVAADADAATPFATFAVRARRSRTGFRHASQEVNETVGDAIRTRMGKAVDLKHPDLLLRIEVSGKLAYVSAVKLPGPGGLPVGTAGRVVALLSAGIDSPVAAWRLMRRGASVVPVHFHGQPFTDRSSERKVEDLLAALRLWGFSGPWYSVPLGEAQREITLAAPSGLRVLLYRRLMLRVAEAIAVNHGALAVVTGESLGQVASQTLENIGAVGSVATLPLLRPLIGTDKIEIIEQAERIGTYAISTEPHQDCCTLFEPKEPATHATAAQLSAAEETYDVTALAADCVARAERKPE